MHVALNDGNNIIELKSLQYAVCILPSICIFPLVCSLHFISSLDSAVHPQSAFYTDRVQLSNGRNERNQKWTASLRKIAPQALELGLKVDLFNNFSI